MAGLPKGVSWILRSLRGLPNHFVNTDALSSETSKKSLDWNQVNSKR